MVWVSLVVCPVLGIFILCCRLIQDSVLSLEMLQSVPDCSRMNGANLEWYIQPMAVQAWQAAGLLRHYNGVHQDAGWPPAGAKLWAVGHACMLPLFDILHLTVFVPKLSHCCRAEVLHRQGARGICSDFQAYFPDLGSCLSPSVFQAASLKGALLL